MSSIAANGCGDGSFPSSSSSSNNSSPLSGGGGAGSSVSPPTSTTTTPTTLGGGAGAHLTYSDVVRGWVEGYEAAITNHYSPELRARVHAARINGISPHLRASVQGAVLGHRCRVVHNPDKLCLNFEKKVSCLCPSQYIYAINM